VRVGPEMKVNVEQERIGESNTDDGDGIGDAKQSGPSVWAEVEKIVERDDQVSGVPSAHGECEGGKYSLDAGQVAAVRDQLEQHPERE